MVINVLLIIVGFINISLAGFVFFRNKKSHINIFYSISVFFQAIWIFFMYLFRTIAEQYLILVAELFYISAIFIGLTFLFFTLFFPSASWQLRRIQSVALFGITAVLIFMILSDQMITGYAVQDSVRTLTFNPTAYSIYAAVIFIFFGWAFMRLLQTHGKVIGLLRSQTFFFTFGSMVSTVIAIITNLILPFAGYFGAFWVGPMMTIIMSIFVQYSIVRYRLFDMQIRLQRVINIVVPILFAMVIAGPIGMILVYYTELTRIAEEIVLLSVTLFSYELFRQYLIRSRFSYLLFQRAHRYHKALETLAKDAASILNIDELSSRIVDTFIDDMHAQKAAILIHASEHNTEFEVLNQQNYSNEELQAMFSPQPNLIAAFSEDQCSYVYDEIDYELQHPLSSIRKHQLEAVRDSMQRSQTTLILALRIQQTVMGFIVLGEKEHGRVYTADDLALLEHISRELAIALANSKLHQEKTRQAELLQKEVEHASVVWKQKSEENQELSHLRSKFISVMSHQLRTPISVIRNSLELVLEDYLSVPMKEDTTISKEQMQHIVRLLRNAFLASDNLNTTTESILAASELIGHIPNLIIQRINTREFLNMRVNRTKRLLEAKSHDDIQLHIDIQEQLQEFFVSDERKCAFILDTLLSNAILYTVQGNVTFRVYIKDQKFVMEVSDTGVGIPIDQQEKIFQRFIRLENAQRVVPDGSGLSLYLAKEYVELLRGSISFVSEEGKGTTFTVMWPTEYYYIAMN